MRHRYIIILLMLVVFMSVAGLPQAAPINMPVYMSNQLVPSSGADHEWSTLGVGSEASQRFARTSKRRTVFPVRLTTWLAVPARVDGIGPIPPASSSAENTSPTSHAVPAEALQTDARPSTALARQSGGYDSAMPQHPRAALEPMTTVTEHEPVPQPTSTVIPAIAQEEITQMHEALLVAQGRMSRARAQFHLQAMATAEDELRQAEEALDRIRKMSLDKHKLNATSTASADGGTSEQQLTLDQAAAELTAAEIALADAEAHLRDISTHPDPTLVATAQHQFDAAQRTFNEVAAQASASKTAAEHQVATVAEEVRQAQDVWSQAYWRNQQAQDGTDPGSGGSFEDAALDAEAQRQHYAALLAAADLQLQAVQSRLAEALAALDHAKQQEVEQVLTSQSHVDGAKAILEAVLQGPRAEDIARAQADVEQANVRLVTARQHLEAITIVQRDAQARLEQEQHVVAAQVQVDVARTRLEQVRRSAGGKGSWLWPTFGTITSGFGKRDLDVNPVHNGIDIANDKGTPIGAARDGVVIEAGWCRGYGYCVKLQHEDGFSSEYGHLEGQPLVQAGQRVVAGTIIGGMGTSYDAKHGGFSTAVHLHVTIRHNGSTVDPLMYLP